MQWKHHAACPQMYTTSDHGQSGVCQRRVRIHSSEGMEMPLRRPDRREPQLVRQFGALNQHLIVALRAFRVCTRKIEKAELDLFTLPTDLSSRCAAVQCLIMDNHDPRPARERP